MNSQKLSSLLLGLFISIVLIAPSLSSTDRTRHSGQSVAAPLPSQVADGSGPVPPLPPLPPGQLAADGSGPVPPLPPSPKPPVSYLMADGSGPVPPLPPLPPNPSSASLFPV